MGKSLRRFRDRIENSEGFTLVELLVVVLIIAILAAVAIPMYLGQQDRAKDSAVKAALQTVQNRIAADGDAGGVVTGSQISQAVRDAGYQWAWNGVDYYAVHPGDIVFNSNFDYATNGNRYSIEACVAKGTTVSGCTNNWCLSQTGVITKGTCQYDD